MTLEKITRLTKMYTKMALRYRGEAYENIEKNYPESSWLEHKEATDDNFIQEIEAFGKVLISE